MTIEQFNISYELGIVQHQSMDGKLGKNNNLNVELKFINTSFTIRVYEIDEQNPVYEIEAETVKEAMKEIKKTFDIGD